MSVTNNDWDDTLLVKAYDSSIKLAQEELARRIARATNNKKTASKARADPAPSVNAEQIACASHSKHSEEENASFILGDYARATYEDGIDYEGKIIGLDEEQGTCRIRYIGYDNEQEVRICDLVPSWGKKARRMQFNRAKQEMQANEATGRGAEQKKSKSQYYPSVGSFPLGAIPPPPPMPPMLFQGRCEDSEHLSAMLMSWYMSGYYTGVYQGIQMAKENSEKQKK